MIKAGLMLAVAQAVALAADPGLLSLVMPDAKVIAGIQVDRGKNSPFARYVLSHMQPDDEGFTKFVAETGFDPRRDLTEILMASSWTDNANAHWLILARGVFNPGKVASVVQLNGGTITNFQGVNLLSGGGSGPKHDMDSVIAFLDASTAVIGDPASVKAAIARGPASGAALTSLAGKVRQVSANNDFWFVTLVPLSEFAGVMPDANLNGAMKGNLLQAVNQASGGIRFSDPVQISAEIVARSDKDAQALVDVVRFLAGLIQLNREKNVTAAEVATLADTLDLKTAGNVMTMSLAIPEATLERIVDGVHVGKHSAAAATK